MLFILYPGLGHSNQNEFNEALNYHNQALEMCQRLHNGDHVDIAVYLSNVGAAYNKLQQWNKSLEYHTKCLEMRRRLFSGDHDKIAFTLNEIGKMKYSRQRYLTKQIKVIIVRQRI